MTLLPTTLNQPPDYHWSPTNQRAFLEHLAIVGSVTLAAKHVGMSARAAYDLKLRRDGAAFKLGWAAAVLIARGRLGDDLLERAIHGYDEEYIRAPADDNGEVRIRRRRIDSRLGMEYLKRLDRMADGVAENAGELQLAQIIMGDWEAFLDRLAPAEGGEGGTAAFACWLAGRDNRFNPLSGLWEKPDEDCEVAQISAGLDVEQIAAPKPELPPEEAAAEMSVWYCDYAEGWRTNFPPPLDFCGEEQGEFGNDGYERDLSEEEAEVRAEQAEAEIAPLREAGEAARRAWFGLGEANTPPFGLSLSKPDPAAPMSFDKLRTKGEIHNEYLAAPEAQAMDPHVHGDDKETSAEHTELETASAETDAECVIRNAPVVRPPPEDPNIRVIRCKPRISWAARGVMPPHIAAELGIRLPHGDPRLE